MSGGNKGKAVFISPEGGIGYWVINKTGGASIKGYIVEPAASTNNGVKHTDPGDADPIGVVYDAGIADGEMIRIIFSGIAHVYYGVAVTRATFSRVPVIADGLLSGQAMNEALPTSPFATDKHFQEIGHPLESIGAPGLALTNLHFN